MNDQPREVAQRFLERVRAVSKDDLRFLKNLAHAILVLLIEVAGKRNALERRVVELQQRVVELQQRVVELQQHVVELRRRKSFEYCGVYDESELYEPDDFVTHQGSLWHTDQATRARPGTPGSSWQLAVKHGRDGRGRE